MRFVLESGEEFCLTLVHPKDMDGSAERSWLLMGFLSFLLVYVLKESKRVNVHMRPRFVTLFAFVFAVVAGTL